MSYNRKGISVCDYTDEITRIFAPPPPASILNFNSH